MSWVSHRKAQTWSFDLLIAVVVFVIVVAIFYTFIQQDTQTVLDTEQLEQEAKSLSFLLNCDLSPNSRICFIENGEINNTKLDQVALLSYDEFKEAAGVEGEVCIYLQDDSGNIIPISVTGAGIGKDTYQLNDTVSCDGS